MYFPSNQGAEASVPSIHYFTTLINTANMSMCRCRVNSCSTCYRFSRCQFDYDGLSIEAKISRKRGGLRTKDGSSDSQREKIRMLYLQIAFRAAKNPFCCPAKKEV